MTAVTDSMGFFLRLPLWRTKKNLWKSAIKVELFSPPYSLPYRPPPPPPPIRASSQIQWCFVVRLPQAGRQTVSRIYGRSNVQYCIAAVSMGWNGMQEDIQPFMTDLAWIVLTSLCSAMGCGAAGPGQLRHMHDMQIGLSQEAFYGSHSQQFSSARAPAMSLKRQDSQKMSTDQKKKSKSKHFCCFNMLFFF